MNLNLPLFEYNNMSHEVILTYFNSTDVADIFFMFANVYVRYFAKFFLIVYFVAFAVRFVEGIVTGKNVNDLGDYLNE